MGIEEKAEALDKVAGAADKAAGSATKYPYGWMVLIALGTAALVCWILVPQIKDCNDKYDSLVLQLLEKNNIINQKEKQIDYYQDTIQVQRDVMREADSTISEVVNFSTPKKRRR